MRQLVFKMWIAGMLVFSGKSLRDGNLGGPKLRVYAGIKIEFFAIALEKGS